MKLIVIGATGTIGSAVAAALEGKHEVVRASRNGTVKVDLADPGSIAALLTSVGAVDAVVCCAVEAFVRAVALEMPRRIRVNAVSPAWVRETLVMLGRDGSEGTPVSDVTRSYVQAVEGTMQGQTIIPVRL